MHLGYTSECCWRCLKWLIFLEFLSLKMPCKLDRKQQSRPFWSSAQHLWGDQVQMCKLMDTQATYSINSCVGRCSRQAAWPAEASGRHTRGHHICLPTRIECLEHFTSGSSGHFPWVLTWTHQTSPHHIWMSWMSREEEQIFGMLPHNNHNTACRGTDLAPVRSRLQFDRPPSI